MTYSYTQISQYLGCPRRYRYRYLDGWVEKETSAGMLFGRAFENALAALFRREDPGQALFDSWSVYRNLPVEYSRGDTWDSMLECGIHLLERFVQDDRVRIPHPRENLQIKFTRELAGCDQFVAYIDAIGLLDDKRSVIDWKTTAARYPEEPAGLLALDPQLSAYSWVTGEPEVAFVVFVRKRLPEIQYLRTTITDDQRQQFGALVQETIRRIESADFLPRPGIRFPQNGCLSCSYLGSAWAIKNWPAPRSSAAREVKTLVGLTSFVTSEPLTMLPKLNRRRALFVLSKIDQILAWERTMDHQRDTKFVELGRYLCEVRAGQYWRLENLKSFDEFLGRRFPESRRKAYYLMSIHEHLPRPLRNELKQVGWAKAAELVKVARSDGQDFESATWLHKARELPKEKFKQEVEKHLTGKETEPYELVTFKLYRSQLPIVEQALETAGLMLGTDKSRGYCLEMICADFLAGAHADEANPATLLMSILRLFHLLPEPEKQRFLEQLGVAA